MATAINNARFEMAAISVGTRAPFHRVKVVVRTRPTDDFAHEHIHFDGTSDKTISIRIGKNEDQIRGFINNKQEGWSFPVDAALHNASQELVYETCARELVVELMKGFNGTLLAYGQTGAGKTYTMCGPQGNYQARGIIPRAIAQVFSEVKRSKDYTYKIHLSYLEIYNDLIFDLLTTLPDDNIGDDSVTSEQPKPLNIAEDERRGVYVKGLTCRQAENEEDALNMLFEGERNRTIAEHSLNKHSSRSHCIFTITVEARSHSKSSSQYTVSRLNLVDLAGSERLSKTKPSGAIEKEAVHINRSLSFLEQVIVALNDGSRDHIPFRQSKLTHFLRDSLGGNSHTVLIANVWGETEQLQETISTLRFATRVRCVQTNPVRNTLKDPQELLKEYEKEIASLKEELAMQNTMLNRSSLSYDTLSELEVEEIRQQVESFLNGTLNDIELVSVKQVKEVFAQFKALALSPDGGVQSGEGHGSSGKSDALSHSASRTKRESKVQTGTGISNETVGETEGVGLGLGIAPATLKHSTSPAAAVKKSKLASKTDTKSKDSKLNTKRTESPAPSVAADEEVAPSEIGSQATRPSTPPPREEAFEDFKKQRGSEINQVFLDNKATLHRKKKEVIEVSAAINIIKKKIDELEKSLSETISGWDGEAEEGVRTEDDDSGEIVVEEWQFSALTRLKELKVSYREQYKKLQSLQQEVDYCSHYVAQSRKKLVEEFEKWYNAAFIGEYAEQLHEEKDNEAESEEREFEKLQEQLNKEPSSAFYTAQLRTQKRGYQKAARQVAVM